MGEWEVAWTFCLNDREVITRGGIWWISQLSGWSDLAAEVKLCECHFYVSPAVKCDAFSWFYGDQIHAGGQDGTYRMVSPWRSKNKRLEYQNAKKLQAGIWDDVKRRSWGLKRLDIEKSKSSWAAIRRTFPRLSVFPGSSWMNGNIIQSFSVKRPWHSHWTIKRWDHFLVDSARGGMICVNYWLVVRDC